ncbi:DUF5723 family protein [Maribacter sp. PR1]|uniref:DUF5723 family protein n=1 Tax=Maribacter cobaltidurans TaxID=1178778 RepID=A0ABU7INT1_9FLAO|nr:MULTISPECIES: DUF5723 family protein [Maribacter]MDC6387230.1 DUF5723 family protein [Maribacter sp. PR1]MEE1974615.1 DUF5723 family protein [Maribacter cobaltidurans]
MNLLKSLSFFLLLFCNFLMAQNKQILYDFNEIPQSLLINPGVETDFKWYSGIPLISGVSGYGGTNGISVNDIFAEDGLDINDKVRQRMVYRMTPRDEFSGNIQLELINFGFRGADPDIFYSMGAYLELDEITYWPQDYAYLIFDGNADQLNRRFDLGDLKTRGSLVSVYHIGMNKKIDDKLTIGARGKIYSGIVDYNSTRNDGYLVNTEGQNNTFTTTLSSDLELRTSGFGALDSASDDGTLSNTLVKRALFGGDLGLGLDLGFSYRFNKQTVLTGSLLDVGFIYHSGDTKSYSLTGNASSEGIEINVLRDFSNLNRDFWQDLVDEIEELVPFESSESGYITFRPTKLNVSLRYDFGKPIGNSLENCDCTINSGSRSLSRVAYRNSIGGHVFLVNRPRGPQSAITAFYMRRLGNILALKATYTADKFSYTNMGFGFSLQAGPINLYAMADNLLSYRNIAASNYASFQLGLNIISWGRK